MCEMVSELCLVMVFIRRSRSFTSVPYYYESVTGVPGLMLISETLKSTPNYWQKLSSACPNRCDRLMQRVLSAFGTKQTSPLAL